MNENQSSGELPITIDQLKQEKNIHKFRPRAEPDCLNYRYFKFNESEWDNLP